MCGIVGSIQTGEHVPLRDAVRRAMDHMVHRGPDGQGLEEFIVRNGTASSTLGAPPIATVLFGHRRLAIIDLSEAARQPMSTPDGRFHLSFNGEIYNSRISATVSGPAPMRKCCSRDGEDGERPCCRA